MSFYYLFTVFLFFTRFVPTGLLTLGRGKNVYTRQSRYVSLGMLLSLNSYLRIPIGHFFSGKKTEVTMMFDTILDSYENFLQSFPFACTAVDDETLEDSFNVDMPWREMEYEMPVDDDTIEDSVILDMPWRGMEYEISFEEQSQASSMEEVRPFSDFEPDFLRRSGSQDIRQLESQDGEVMESRLPILKQLPSFRTKASYKSLNTLDTRISSFSSTIDTREPSKDVIQQEMSYMYNMQPYTSGRKRAYV